MSGEVLVRVIFTLSDLSIQTSGVEFADFWHHHNHCFAKHHYETFKATSDPHDIFQGEVVQKLWDSMILCGEPLKSNGPTPLHFSLDVLFMGHLLLALKK